MERLLHPRDDGGPFPCSGDSGYIPAWASPEVLGQTGLSPVPLSRGDWQVSIKRRAGTAVAFLGEPVPVNPSVGSMSRTTLLVLVFLGGGGVSLSLHGCPWSPHLACLCRQDLCQGLALGHILSMKLEFGQNPQIKLLVEALSLSARVLP